MFNLWFIITVAVISVVVFVQFFFKIRKKIAYSLLLCFIGSLVAHQVYYYFACSITEGGCEAGTLSIIGDIIFVLIVFGGSAILNTLVDAKRRG